MSDTNQILEDFFDPDPSCAAMSLVLQERYRQVFGEGFGADRDDGYRRNELALAAAGYLLHETGASRRKGVSKRMPDGSCQPFMIPACWPVGWEPEWFKPSGRLRDLVKAGALVLAEIERLQRLEKNSEPVGPGYEIDDAGKVRFLIDDEGGGQ